MGEAMRTQVSHLSPLQGCRLPASPEFTVTEAQPTARFILRGEPDIVIAVGFTTPPAMRTASTGTRTLLWLGPDEYLLIAPGEEPETVTAELQTRLAALPHSLVDISHRQTGLILDGVHAARCLSAGCPLDMRLAAFPVGMVARTIFLKTEMVLLRLGETRFHLEIWRSFAPYMLAHLVEAQVGIQDRNN